MNRFVMLIWYWCLCVLPLTSLMTFIITLVVCSQHPYRWSKNKLPNISNLGTGSAYSYFLSGFILLIPQILIILIGRLEYLLRSQCVINRFILIVAHSFGFVSLIFLLIMSVVSIDDNGRVHLIGAIGTFGSLSSYCLFHTIVVIYLYIRRSNASEHWKKFYPIWFIVCSMLLLICFIIWGVTYQSIPQYIAAASPFLYVLAFIPQFIEQARMKTSN